MSDEMVQDKTEPADAVAPEAGAQEHPAFAPEVEAPVESAVVAVPAVTDEPAPSTHQNALPQGVAVSEETDVEAFERAMEALEGASSVYEKSLHQLQQDTVITGTVMRVDREGVLVDVGAKSEGIIRLSELSRDPAASLNPESIVSVGQKIKVYVMEAENQEGIPVLSKKRADFEDAWEKVQQYRQSGETIHAMVQDRVKGGLVVDLGIRGFVPASHVGNGSLKNNLDRYVGQSIPLKVIEVDKERRKVVLSNKLAVAEERDAKSAETKSSLSPNQIRHGVVRRLTNYGAFIDLGGIDGLLHISEMSWTRINDPKEVLREGQELDVIVLKMDLENNRVSLGLRQILPDPWSEIKDRYKEGDVIIGTVTRLVPFGAFVQVEGGVEGIIPSSELPRIKGKVGPPVNVNDEVTVKLINLRPEERKMTLSLRALQPAEEREAAPAREPAAREVSPREPSAREGGGGKRARSERDDREDYRPSGGRQQQDEPRFNAFGEAYSAAKRNKRDRRSNEDELDDDYLDDAGVELEAEAEAEPESEANDLPLDHTSDSVAETEIHHEGG
jgi:ribosomal protein S1